MLIPPCTVAPFKEPLVQHILIDEEKDVRADNNFKGQESGLEAKSGIGQWNNPVDQITKMAEIVWTLPVVIAIDRLAKLRTKTVFASAHVCGISEGTADPDSRHAKLENNLDLHHEEVSKKTSATED